MSSSEQPAALIVTQLPCAKEKCCNGTALSSSLQVLSIGETVEEVSDSGFLATSPTLRTQLLVDDSMLQVSTVAVCYSQIKGSTVPSIFPVLGSVLCVVCCSQACLRLQASASSSWQLLGLATVRASRCKPVSG